jgi:hypothetical protein
VHGGSFIGAARFSSKISVSMGYQRSTVMRRLLPLLLLPALTALSGCVVYPAGGGYYGRPYVAPPPVYARPYYAPYGYRGYGWHRW